MPRKCKNIENRRILPVSICHRKSETQCLLELISMKVQTVRQLADSSLQRIELTETQTALIFGIKLHLAL